MNALDLRESDMILLPKRGAMPSRQVLVIDCEEATYYDIAEDQDMPLLDPGTGLPLYKISYLREDSHLGEAWLLAKQISLISRVTNVSAD